MTNRAEVIELWRCPEHGVTQTYIVVEKATRLCSMAVPNGRGAEPAVCGKPLLEPLYVLPIDELAAWAREQLEAGNLRGLLARPYRSLLDFIGKGNSTQEGT